MAKLTFLGAAGTVTGSKYLVEAAGKKLLLDCGIFQGSPELSARNFKVTDRRSQNDRLLRADACSPRPHGLAAVSGARWLQGSNLRQPSDH